MYQLGIEKIGIPTVTIVTNEFMGLARSTMKSQGAPDMAFVEIQHPVGGIRKEEVEAKAKTIIDDIIQKATSWKSAADVSTAKESYYPAKTVKIRGTYDDVNDFYFKQKWTDGFPIIPPTKEKVKAMLAGTSAPPDKVIMKIPPRKGGLTVEGIAINAVMAGCEPEYMPVLVSAFELISKAYDRKVGPPADPGNDQSCFDHAHRQWPHCQRDRSPLRGRIARTRIPCQCHHRSGFPDDP